MLWVLMKLMEECPCAVHPESGLTVWGGAPEPSPSSSWPCAPVPTLRPKTKAEGQLTAARHLHYWRAPGTNPGLAEDDSGPAVTMATHIA